MLQRRKEPFVLLLTCTDDDQLHTPLQQPFSDVAQKIDALVPCKTRDHGEHRHVVIDGKPQTLLQRALISKLAFTHVAGVIERGKTGRFFGIEQLHVDAVCNTAEGRTAA